MFSVHVLFLEEYQLSCCAFTRLSLELHRTQVVAVSSSRQATTCVRWSCCLKECFCTRFGRKGRIYNHICDLLVMPCWLVLTRTEQLYIAATARVIWLCTCVRCWPYRSVRSVYFCSWLWSTSVNFFCTLALLLLDSIFTPWRGAIQKSITRVQANFSSLDVGSPANIIFPEFAQVSLLSGSVFGWVFYFLSVDLKGTSSGSDWEGAWGQQGAGSPGRIFRLLSRFCLILWTFSPFVTNRFLKAYMWDVSPRYTAQGAHPSIGPLSPQSKTLTCSDGAIGTYFPVV